MRHIDPRRRHFHVGTLPHVVDRIDHRLVDLSELDLRLGIGKQYFGVTQQDEMQLALGDIVRQVGFIEILAADISCKGTVGIGNFRIPDARQFAVDNGAGLGRIGMNLKFEIIMPAAGTDNRIIESRIAVLIRRLGVVE